jgi:hypothetical protein
VAIDFRGTRVFASLAVWVLLLPLAVRGARGQTPPAAPTDFDVVEVDLNGQTFNRVLPFDVPFIITGAVPQGVNSLEVRCWKLDTENRKKTGKPIPLSPERRQSEPQGNCWPVEPLVWRNTIDPGTPSPKFRVLAPSLEAESYYQFDFTFVKTITPQEAQAFAQKAQAAIDPVLWGDPQKTTTLPASGDLTRAEVTDIRQRLVEALQQAAGVTFVPVKGSIFNPDTPFEDVRKEFKGLLRPVRDAQQKIRDAVASYRGEIENLNALLARIRDGSKPEGSLLRRLQDALASEAAPASAKAHADEVAAALAVPDAPFLLPGDLDSAASLAAFVEKSASYFSDAAEKIGALCALLASGDSPCRRGRPGGLIAPDGSPQPWFAPVAAAGKLSKADLESLVAMGSPRGLVGTIDRALSRASGDLQSDTGVQGELDKRARAVAAVGEAFRTRVENMIVVAGSTTGSFQTQSNNYISADAGVACAPELSSCSSYVGTNIYFRPVNKAAPLNRFGPFFSRASLARRVSLTIGLTVQGIGDSGKTREDLFNNQSLVVGVGARLTNSVRFTAGSLVFKKLSPNPLSTSKDLTTTYFVSLSFDVDVVPTLKGIGGILK